MYSDESGLCHSLCYTCTDRAVLERTRGGEQSGAVSGVPRRSGAVGGRGRGRGDRKGVGVGGGVVIIVFSNSFFKHGGMGLEGLPVSSCAVVKVKASPPPPPALGSQPQTPEAPSS